MAVAAVDAESGDVMLMAEGHRLRPADSSIGNVRGALNLHCDPAERGNYEHRAKNRSPGESIRAAMKNLRHARVLNSENTYQKIRTRLDRSRFGNLMVTAQKKRATEAFAPAMRTGDYKYFARSCRAFLPRTLEKFLKSN